MLRSRPLFSLLLSCPPRAAPSSSLLRGVPLRPPSQFSSHLLPAALLGVRHASTEGSRADELDLSELALGDSSTQAVIENVTQTLVEPSFQSLGLGHVWPSGWMQSVMEIVHNQGGLEWWATIISTTVVVRFLLFPVVIAAQQNMMKMNKHGPEMNKMQRDAMDPNVSEIERKKNQEEMMAFMAKHSLNPFANLRPILFNATCFMSMFFGLRGMAEAPVESMKTEGLYWFTDLTLTDPFFLLPTITSLTLFLHIKLGADGVDSVNMNPVMRKVLLAMPFLTFPFMCYFPAALNVYWLTNNVMSIGQARFLRHPAIREKFGLGEMRVWTKAEQTASNPFSMINEQWKEAQEKVQQRTEEAARAHANAPVKEVKSEVKSEEELDVIRKNLQEQLAKNAEERERKRKIK